MRALEGLEKQLTDIFKGAPKLSGEAKETLARFWPWLALIGGIAQLIVAWLLYGLTRTLVTPLLDYANTLSVATTGQPVGPTNFDKTLIYLGIIMLVVDAVILLMAYPELKKRTKKGWDLIFLASVINIAYAVLSLFLYGRGFSGFLGSLIGSVIGFYLLFQVREKFSGSVRPRVTAIKK